MMSPLSTRALTACLAFTLLAAPAWVMARQPSKPLTMAARSLKRGMTGYGLTVMRGQKIERFDIEVIGVMHNRFPGMDLILVRCDKLNLKHTGIIAGMSGSPVFVHGPDGKDRLIGAVSYGFAFNKDPVAGVTPIASMWPEMSRPLRPVPETQRIAKVSNLGATSPSRVASVSAGWGPKPHELRPIALPLSLAGFHPSVVKELGGEFEAAGMQAVSAAAGGTNAPMKSAPFEPGSAISLSLVRGDMSMAGVGTVTWVHGDRFIAFGHPFQGVGQVHLPVGNAHIVHVTASQVSSFKMGIPLNDIGVLDQDRLPAVAGRIGPRVKMIPMSVRVVGKGGGVDRTWNVEVVDQPRFFPLVVNAVMRNALKLSEPVISDAAMKMTMRFELEGGYPDLVFKDQIFSMGGSSGLFRAGMLARKVAKLLVSNGFKRIRTRRVTATFEVSKGRPVGIMDAIVPTKSEVRVGEKPVLKVTFMRPNSSPMTVKLQLPKIPKELAGEKIRVWVGAGSRKPVEAPPPRDIEDVFKVIRAMEPSDRLVAVIKLPERSWMIRGERLTRLPDSVMDELSGHTRTGRLGYESLRVGKQLDMIVEGSGNITLQVADED